MEVRNRRRLAFAIGVPSAPAIAYGRSPAAAYNLFAIERDGDDWRCQQTVRSIDDSLGVGQLRQVRLS